MGGVCRAGYVALSLPTELLFLILICSETSDNIHFNLQTLLLLHLKHALHTYSILILFQFYLFTHSGLTQPDCHLAFVFFEVVFFFIYK